MTPSTSSTAPKFGTIIIGAGQAGQQVAESLRAGGYTPAIALLGDEPHLPYQLPPLSKGYLKGAVDRERLAFRSEAFYDDKAITLLRSARVEAIDCDAQTVTTATQTFSYENLVIATGSRPIVPPIPGVASDRIAYMRTLDDADNFAALVERHQRFVVLGAGFIGLEAAASLRHFGKQVTVVEAAARVMARVVSPAISAYFQQRHQAEGVELLTGGLCTALEETAQGLTVALDNGQSLTCDALLMGVGALPNDDIAQAAGIACARGVEVDAQQRTNWANVYAAGDCAVQHSAFWGGSIRLESVQNAMDQGKIIAANILGTPTDYAAVPWFWSDQYDVKFQMAGLGKPDNDLVSLGDSTGGKFSIAHFRDGALTCVESVNQPGDHMAARQLLGQAAPVTRAELATAGNDLRALFKSRRDQG